jgi:hypothetical protein
MPSKMRKVPRVDRKKKNQDPALPLVRRNSLPPTESQKPGCLQSEEKHARKTLADAIARINSLANDGEGYTLTILGIPRIGKTYLAKKIAANAVFSDEIVIVHEPKIPTGYSDRSRLMADVTDLSDEKIVNQATNLPPDDLALTALALSRGGARTLIIYDEATRILGANQRFQGPSLPLLWSEGASQGCSTILLSQCPQWLPRETVDLVTCTVIFRLAGRSLTAVCDLYRLTQEQTDAIRSLSVGEFILLTSFEDWDRTVYGPK